jgi:hypothetical protein
MAQVSRVFAGVDCGMPTPARIYGCMLRSHPYLDIDTHAAGQILSADPVLADGKGRCWPQRRVARRP